jgi:hypothetical protein
MLARRASQSHSSTIDSSRATAAAQIACTALDVLAACLRDGGGSEFGASGMLYLLAQKHADAARDPDLLMWQGSSLSLERLVGRHEGAMNAYEHAAVLTSQHSSEKEPKP